MTFFHSCSVTCRAAQNLVRDAHDPQNDHTNVHKSDKKRWPTNRVFLTVIGPWLPRWPFWSQMAPRIDFGVHLGSKKNICIQKLFCLPVYMCNYVCTWTCIPAFTKMFKMPILSPAPRIDVRTMMGRLEMIVESKAA